MTIINSLDMLRIAAGRAPGIRFVEFLARNPLVDTGSVPETISPAGGLLTFRSAAAVVEVVSSSVEDDPDKGGSVAGTGAWSVTVSGLDVNWNEIEEVIALNGTAAVAGTKEFLRINAVMVASAGTGKTNAGNITVRDASAGTTRNYVGAGRGRSETSMFSVPANHTFLGDGWYATCGLGSGNKSQAYLDVIEAHNAGAGIKHSAWSIGIDGSFASPFTIPHPFPGKTDIHVQVTSVAANSSIISFHGHGILVGPNADL
jgi:hypothetical protein